MPHLQEALAAHARYIARKIPMAKMRLRKVLVAAFCTSCLLMFSSIRCALFSVSCTPNKPIKHLHTNNINIRHFSLDYIGNVTSTSGNNSDSYPQALESQADKNGVIILISTDFGYIQMALNLYYTSLKKFNITNYLYVTSDNEAAVLLKKHGIAHFIMGEDKDGKTMSEYGTPAFRRKTHIKTNITYQALQLGYTVLIVDVDIVFVKNPLQHLTCADCDIQMQSDGREGNSGFYLARPTPAGITLHKTALETAARSPGLSNQKAVDRAMEKMVREKKLKMKTLTLSEFPHGLSYFEIGHRMFAGDNPCKTCVIVHNNWIITGAAKVYRFKEHLLWHVDNDGYYTNPNAKYLTYENPIDFGKSLTTSMETEALLAALRISHLLGRILILPAFNCYCSGHGGCNFPQNEQPRESRCSLNSHFRVKNFDKAFKTTYREHTFLRHPLIPKDILQSQSETILIKTNPVEARLEPSDLQAIKHLFTPANSITGVTSDELLQWLLPFSSFKVLRFHSMYKALGKLSPHHVDKDFEASLGTGVEKAVYRQY